MIHLLREIKLTHLSCESYFKRALSNSPPTPTHPHPLKIFSHPSKIMSHTSSPTQNNCQVCQCGLCAKHVPTTHFYVPTCQHAKGGPIIQLAVPTCQRHANFLTWRANVPKGMPNFQTFL